ncbi:MAG TPA: serine/threonine-protein kinase [Chthoniobacterales bacterium]
MRARIQFNHFTLLELLGEGGMGSVYKALDRNLDRKVALKILKADAASTEADWEKLATEARMTAAVNHPNVVKVYSFGEDHGQFYLAMELVEKGSLDGLMLLQTRLSEMHVLDLAIQATEGLRAAYEVGLIHRDIKPGNILFANAKLAKVVDFGLARVMDEGAQEAGEIWGTPFYVAPEKLDGRPEDFRSDIYSLGGTLFHALSGRPPFDAKTASMVVLKHIKSQAVSLQAFAPGISDETAYVINRMLNKDPDQRYASHEELLQHLHYARQQLQERTSKLNGANEARSPYPPRQGTRPLLIGMWTAAASLALAACVGVLISLRSPHPGAASGVTSGPEAALVAQGRTALNARKFDEAVERFTAAVTAAGTKQPERNWALAQLALATTLGGKGAPARDTFAALARDGIFNPELTAQPLGRLFIDLGRSLEGDEVVPAADAEKWSTTDADAFALLAFGMKDWTAGRVADGGAFLERFARATPPAPNRWIADFRPLTEPYLAEYRNFLELQALVKNATKASAASLLVKIEKAKEQVKTGPPMIAQLDALAQGLPLD